jgi:hypothetical protein
MKNKDIAEAEMEAKRFLSKLEDYKESGLFYKDSYCNYPSKERAALRRSSMDLTKSLSKMRKPWRDE